MLAALACGEQSVTAPDAPALVPGRYVLSRVGEDEAPFVYYQVDYADTLTIAFSFVFDTVQILNDSTFARHFRREARELRPALPDVISDSDEFSFQGIILDRGDEVKLTTRTGAPGGTVIAYFVPHNDGLARHTQRTRYVCQLTLCTLVEDRRLDAWYEPR